MKRIHAGRGPFNNVQDVVDLCGALTPFESVVTAACGKGALAQARAAAEAALTAAGAETASTSEATASADLRDRYATLVVQRHDRLRVAGSLVSSFKQAQKIVGGLQRSSRRKSKEVVERPEAPAYWRSVRAVRSRTRRAMGGRVRASMPGLRQI